jgi:hypothetical protein
MSSVGCSHFYNNKGKTMQNTFRFRLWINRGTPEEQWFYRQVNHESAEYWLQREDSLEGLFAAVFAAWRCSETSWKGDEELAWLASGKRHLLYWTDEAGNTDYELIYPTDTPDKWECQELLAREWSEDASIELEETAR